MRKSRVLLAGVAVAAAGVTTSAFTASNTSTVAASDLKAGYGEVIVTGVEVTNIVYNPLAADRSKLDTVVFTATGNVAAQRAFMTLKNTAPVTVNSYDACVLSYSSPSTTITCTATGNPAIASFDTVGLTVTH